MEKYFKSKNKGFTLIELLVVVAIVGLLSSVVFSSLNNARMKSNDSRRVSDLKQISNALELYYNDNGHYPIGAFDSRSSSDWDIFAGHLAPFMSPLPIDPKNGSGEGSMCGNCGEYYYRSGEGWTADSNINVYMLSTYLANNKTVTPSGSSVYGYYYSIHTCRLPQNNFWHC